MRRNVLRHLISLWLLLAFSGANATDPGYRMKHYRAPTPPGLEGALTVDTAGARKIVEGGGIPVDTTPVTRTGFTDMTGKWNVVEPRENIPDSLWLPNIGYGTLDTEMLDYLQSHLVQATGNDLDVPLIFYCYADCWMSWNAAKRAIELGYRRVIWYPDGTDGWRAAGLPLVEGSPIPLFEDK